MPVMRSKSEIKQGIGHSAKWYVNLKPLMSACLPFYSKQFVEYPNSHKSINNIVSYNDMYINRNCLNFSVKPKSYLKIK